jgi:hypothetical protein
VPTASPLECRWRYWKAAFCGVSGWCYYVLVMTIDTLEFVKKLEAAGVDRKLAEALAEALRATVVQDLATKNDLQSEVQRLESKIQLLTWMVGFNLAATMAVLWKLLR